MESYSLFRLWTACVLTATALHFALPEDDGAPLHALRHTLRAASPTQLATLVATAGPLPTWLPILFCADDAADARPFVHAATCRYLAFIGVVRHTHLVLASHFDPSGHIFIIGTQIVAATLAPPLRPLVRRAIVGWCAMLIYLSVATAAVFHSPPETIAGYLLVVLPYSPGIFVGVAGARSDVSLMRRAGLLGERGSLFGALVAWVLCTAAAWALVGDETVARGVLSSQLLYDILLFSLLLWTAVPSEYDSSRRTLDGTSGFTVQF